MGKSGLMALVAVAALVFAATPGVGAEEGKAKVGKLEHRINMDVEYPVTGQAKVDRIIQDWLEKRLEKTVESFTGVVLDPDIDETSVTLSAGFREVKPSARAVSYIFDVYSYPWRAAHPMSYAHVLNIDLDKREQVKFEDVFAHPKRALKIMAEKAPEAVRKDLAERLPDRFKDGVPGFNELGMFMEGFDAKSDNYAAFSLEPNGVRVIFQLYQVLPYVYGKPEAFFSLEELAEAGPNLGLWGK